MPAPGARPGTANCLGTALALRGLGKRFNRQVALEAVDLTLERGEVHGLVGENGSGKSTLIKVLAGLYAPDDGELYLAGRQVPFPTRPGEFRRYGLAFVHQDLGLVGDLSVAENLAVTDLASSDGPWRVSRRSLRMSARDQLGHFEVDLDPAAPVSSLAAVDRAKVAIVRALASIDSGDAEPSGVRVRVLVLDEPTVFLPRREVDRLFELVRHVAAGGASILFVSHDLDEVWENCDVLTVLRDGRVAGHRRADATTVGEMVELIVGRSVAGDEPAPAPPAAETLVDVAHLSGATIADLDLAVGSGEILGVTGLAGSGFEELPYLLYGARRALAGTVSVDGSAAELSGLKPRRALEMGMILVPGDRRRHGIVGSLSITDNVTLPQLQAMSRSGFLSRRRMAGETRTLMDRFDIRPRDPGLDLGILSGGNQQKGVLAKWLSTEPKLVLLDEPTQGVDIGAREQIFEALRATAGRGAAVLCASSDYAQLAALCHRVVVLRDGAVVAELEGASLSKSQISEACLSAGSRALQAPPSRAGVTR